jgi:hypothetical protein
MRLRNRPAPGSSPAVPAGARTRCGPLVAAALALLAVGPAAAGPWPREPGETFLALRADVERTAEGPDTDASAYVERGLTRRITLVGQFSTADDPWTPSRAATGLRFALSAPDAVNRFAVSLGVSAPPDLMGAMTSARLEAGLAWGRGFESRWGGGWVTADARFLFARDAKKPITDLAALVGVRPADGWMLMLGGSRYKDPAGVYWKLSPAFGYEVRPELWLVPNFTQELSDDRSASVGLSVWFSF